MSAHEQEGDGGPERALDLPKVTQELITSSPLPSSAICYGVTLGGSLHYHVT